MTEAILVLDSIPADLKTCQPNLMPFHISYNGPASIATFMDVKPAKKIDCEADPSLQEVKLENEEASTSTGHPQSTNQSALLNESTPTATSTRSISTFRGRTIQGLKVDLPKGYRGLVLQAPAQTAAAFSTAQSSSSSSSSQPQPDLAEQAPTTRRKKGRLTRSAVSTRVVDVDQEEVKRAKEAAINVDDLMDVDKTEAEQDNAPQRKLKAISEFSSFTIWHADHPVVENQDEYYRSVHEWTALAAALHQDDGEEEGTTIATNQFNSIHQ